jgi:hypothetical protein
MIFMGANSLLRPLEGVGPENWDFLGPETASSESSSIWAHKSRDLLLQMHKNANYSNITPSPPPILYFLYSEGNTGYDTG